MLLSTWEDQRIVSIGCHLQFMGRSLAFAGILSRFGELDVEGLPLD